MLHFLTEEKWKVAREKNRSFLSPCFSSEEEEEGGYLKVATFLTST